jgi:hypothetical protein
MKITVDCSLLLFDIMERIQGTDFSLKLLLFPTSLVELSAKKKAVLEATLPEPG